MKDEIFKYIVEIEQAIQTLDQKIYISAIFEKNKKISSEIFKDFEGNNRVIKIYFNIK